LYPSPLSDVNEFDSPSRLEGDPPQSQGIGHTIDSKSVDNVENPALTHVAPVDNVSESIVVRAALLLESALLGRLLKCSFHLENH